MAVKMKYAHCVWMNIIEATGQTFGCLIQFLEVKLYHIKKTQSHKIFVPSLTSTLFLPYDLILSIFLISCACKLLNLHLTIIFPLIHPPHPSSACFFLLPHHSIWLLNRILTPMINNRLAIPPSINIPPSLLWASEALQFLSPLEVRFTPFLTVCAGLFSPHSFLPSLSLCCVSFSFP